MIHTYFLGNRGFLNDISRNENHAEKDSKDRQNHRYGTICSGTCLLQEMFALLHTGTDRTVIPAAFVVRFGRKIKGKKLYCKKQQESYDARSNSFFIFLSKDAAVPHLFPFAHYLICLLTVFTYAVKNRSHRIDLKLMRIRQMYRYPCQFLTMKVD